MKKRATVLLLVLAMVLSFATPAMASSDEDIMTLTALAEQDENYAEKLPADASKDDKMTWDVAIAYLLRAAGMPEAQLGIYPDDYAGMADSLGMIGDDYDGDDTITVAEFNALKADDGLADLTAAMAAETKEPLFVDGLAQPIFPYTTGAVEEGYSNEESDIIRFCVYVETNYDTDNDGQLDLVKALVQLPRAAAEGDFQAATIYEARPYITGCTDRGMEYNDEELGYDAYSNTAEPRNSATGTIDSWESSIDFVNAADSSDWYYYNPFEKMMDYEDLEWYDYYLVRGFAVVECGGLGTRGSEGFESCGANIEIDAFKCVIEWLNGASDRVAYTDKDATTAIEAYWSNGSVGMTGRSYAGTTQFGLATTGVEGLKTIVPVAGISSWYEYTNAQGISTRTNVAYTNTLAAYCAGRYLDSQDGADKGVVDADVSDYASIAESYGSFLRQMQLEQMELNGDYGDHWAIRDYTLDAENIQCPALIVHGLNDYNVRTKMFAQMYEAFETAGQDVKLLLHQDGHLTPTYPAGNLVFHIGEQTYDEILNQWFSHYLYNVENGAEDMPAVTAQDSHEAGVWNTYDSWETAKYMVLAAGEDTEETTTISSDYSLVGADLTDRRWTRNFNWQGAMINDGSTPVSSMYAMEVAEDTTIKGTVAVNFSATASNPVQAEESAGNAAAAPQGDMPRGTVDHDNMAAELNDEVYMTMFAMLANDVTPIEERDALMVSAMLVDIAPEGETFPVFNTSGSYVPKTTLKEGGAWMGGGLANYDLTIHNTTDVPYKVVTRGWMDLANPNAGFDSASAARTEKVALGGKNDYTLYLQPTVYEVEAGHTLALVIYTYEPGMATYTDNYCITIDNASVDAQIPVDGVEEKDPSSSGNASKPSINTGAQKGDEEQSSGAWENPYQDVTTGDWYYEAVQYVTEKGLMNGVSTDLFASGTNVTRGMMVTLLYRMENSPAVAAASAFEDVAAGMYYSDAVAWASANGIVNGYSATSFAPNASITREQLAAMLYRYAQYKGYDVSVGENTNILSYDDAAEISAYAVPAVQWACGAGLLNGRTAATIVPNGTANRAEAATILMRFMENVAK